MLSETEILYSPSKWSHRENVIAKHIDFAVRESDKSRKLYPCQLNIPYGQNEAEKIDIYGTDLPNHSPIFIYIHGGYWQELNKNISSYVVEPFYKNKIKTIIVGYTLCPNASLSEITEEIEKAILKCIDYAKTHGSKSIYISGYSAGSHLIANLFHKFYPSLSKEDRSLFKAAILCCGVYNLLPLVNTYINDLVKLTNETAEMLSPMHQKIPTLEMTVFVVVGEHDSPAFKEQSKLYFNKVKDSCCALFKVIKGVDHFSIVEKYKEMGYELVQFILNMEKLLTNNRK